MAHNEQTTGAGGADPSVTLGPPEGGAAHAERPLVGTHDIEELEVRARALEALIDPRMQQLLRQGNLAVDPTLARDQASVTTCEAP